MQYRYMGKANVQVSTICLGTMHFGAKTEERDAFAIMDRAVDLGINFFDTANVYGGSGRTEEIIGRWLQQGGGRRDRIVLATKVYGQMVRGEAVPPNEGPGISWYKVHKQVEDSLRRLQTDHIDLYQVHHIDRHISPAEYWTMFDTLVADGKVLYTGTSNFPGWGLAKYQLAAEQRGSVGIVSEQAQYNLLSRYPELEVIPAAEAFGIGIMVYMPVAGGLLTGKPQIVPGSRTQSVEAEYGIGPRLREQVEAFSALCRDLGEPEHVVATAWTLANPGVYSAIVGVRTLAHLEGLERAAELRLSAPYRAAGLTWTVAPHVSGHRETKAICWRAKRARFAPVTQAESATSISCAHGFGSMASTSRSSISPFQGLSERLPDSPRPNQGTPSRFTKSG